MARTGALLLGLVLAFPVLANPGQEMTRAEFDQELHGVHDMKGVITAIDKNTGIVEVRAGDKELRLHFPPPEVIPLNEGDVLKFRMGIVDTNAP